MAKRVKLFEADIDFTKLIKNAADAKSAIISLKKQINIYQKALKKGEEGKTLEELEVLNSKLREQQATYKTLTSLIDAKTNKVIEARVKILELNKVKRQEARENFGLVGAYEKLTKQRNAAQRKLANLLSTEGANTEEIKKATEAYSELNDKVLAIDRAKKAHTDVTDKERIKEQELNKVKRQQTREQLGLVGAYERLNRQRTQAQRRLANLLSAEVINRNEVRKAEREYSRLNKRVLAVDKATNNYTKNIGNYQSAFRGLRGSLTKLTAAFGVTGGIYLFARALRNAIDVAKDFEISNAHLAAILQKEKDEITALTEQAIHLGAITLKTAQQVSNLQINYARLGFSQKEILDVTESTIQGSIALNGSLEETANLTGAIIRTFDEFSSVDAPTILDEMSLATARSALNFQKLKEEIPFVGKAADEAGVSFTTLLALLGKLADAGITASVAATSLRNILLESEKRHKNYIVLLQQVANSTDRLGKANEIFGKRASVAASILSANIDKVEELDKTLQHAGGTTEFMANKEINTLVGALELLRSRWQGIILQANEATGATANLRKAINFLTDHLGTLLKWTVRVTGVLLAYKAVILAIRTAQRLVTASTIAFKVATGNLVSVGITAAIVALSALATTLFKTRKAYNLLTKIRKDAIRQIAGEKARIEDLITTANDDLISKEKRKDAIAKLNAISPEYLRNITLETINTKNAKKAINEYLVSLQKRAEAEAAYNKVVSLQEELLAKQLNVIGEYRRFFDKYDQAFTNYDDAVRYQPQLDSLEKQIDATIRSRKQLYEFLNTKSLEAPLYEAVLKVYEPYLKKKDADIKKIKSQIDLLEQLVESQKRESAVKEEGAKESKKYDEQESEASLKAQLKLFKAQAKVQKRSLDEQLEYLKAVKAQEGKIIEREYEGTINRDTQKNLALQKIDNEYNQGVIKATVENAQNRLEIWKNFSESRISGNKAFNETIYNQETKRLEDTAQKEKEFQDIRLKNGVINRQEYNNAIAKIDLKSSQDKQELDRDIQQATKARRQADLEDEITYRLLMGESITEAKMQELEKQRQIEIDNAQQDSDRKEEALVNLQMDEEQKTELLLLLETNRQEAINAIKQFYQDKSLEVFKKTSAIEIKERQRAADSIISIGKNVAFELAGLLGDTLAGKLAQIAIEAAIQVGLIKITSAASQARNLAQATAALPPPLNIPLIGVATAQNAIIAAQANKSVGTVLAAAAIQGLGTVVGDISQRKRQTAKEEKERPKTYALKEYGRGGLIKGKSHELGGEPAIIDRKQPVEIEGGEFIVNEKSTKAYLPILKQINDFPTPPTYIKPHHYQMGGIARTQTINNQLRIDYDLLARKIGEQTAEANAETLPEVLPNKISVTDIDQTQDNQVQVTSRL